MDSLLAQLARKERHRLSVARVDVEERPELAKRFKVRTGADAVLVQGKRAVARLEGRANAAEIEELVEPHSEARKPVERVAVVGPNRNRRGGEHMREARDRRFARVAAAALTLAVAAALADRGNGHGTGTIPERT